MIKSYIVAILLMLYCSLTAQVNTGIPFPAPPARAMDHDVTYDIEGGLQGSHYYFTSLGRNIVIQGTENIAIGGIDTVFEVPAGREVKDVKGKVGYYEKRFLFLLDNGQVIEVYKTGPSEWATETWNFMSQNQFENYKEIIGDDVYVRTSQSIYVTRDSGTSWQRDTAGIPAASQCYNMAMDTLQYVYLSTVNGLYKQALGSNVWQLKSAAGSNVQRVFCDRYNRLWVTGNGGLQVSNDGGDNFSPGPSGISSGEAIISVVADKYANVYVLTTGNYFNEQGNKVYRSAGGTQNFTRIDQTIAVDFTQYGQQNFYTAITGDSFLCVSSYAGLHLTADGGNTWIYRSVGPSDEAYSLVPAGSGNLLMSTGPGVFSGNASNWSKKFPVQGFQGNIMLFKDDIGNIFAQAESNGTNSNNNQRRNVYKSTDGGNTFNIDTAGMSLADVGMEKFVVDEAGTQYAAGSSYVAGFGSRLTVWEKENGQNWTIDTIGLPEIYNSATILSLTSDDHGSIYLCINNSGTKSTYSKSISGTSWSVIPDLNNMTITEVAGKSGTTVFGGQSLTKKTSNTYTNIPLPGGVNSNDVVYTSVEFDAKGVLWAYFEIFKFPAPASYGSGVFYTSDFQNWKTPQGNIDTARFRTLVAAGDSVFALPLKFEGVYVYDTGTVNIPTSIIPYSGDQIFVSTSPNPFSERLLLTLHTPSTIKADIILFDIAGRAVKKLSGKLIAPGNSTIEFDTKDLPNGVYSYRVSSTEFTKSGKVILQR